MKTTHHCVVCTLAILLCVAAVSSRLTLADTTADLDALLSRMPVDTVAERNEITAGLAELGAAGVREMCGRLKEEPLDGKVCSALHALAHAAGKPGAESLRRTVTGVFSEVLRSKATIAAKSHLLGELRTLGRAEAVGPAGELLSVAALCEPAAQVLVSIGTEEAAAALREALPLQRGAGRVTVICALGRLRDRKAIPLVLQAVTSPDPIVRHAAVFALSESGDPAAGEALRKAAGDESARERRHCLHCLLQFAARLTEEGHAQEASELCRWLMRAFPEESHIQCASLSLLARTGGSRAFPEIIDAMASENSRIRSTARGLIASLPRGAINMTEESIAGMLEGATPVKHAEILKLLGQFANKVGLPAVRDGLRSDETVVRHAAITALGRMGGKAEVPSLVSILKEHERGSEEYRLAETALGGLPGDEATKAIVKTMTTADAATAVNLLGILARRDVSAQIPVLMSVAESHENGDVRVAAIEALRSALEGKHVPGLVALVCKAGSDDERRAAEKVLISAQRRIADANMYAMPIKARLAGAPAEARLTLLRVLAVVEDEAALDIIANAAGDADEAVRETAIRSLAKSKGTAAMKPLWDVVLDPHSEKEAILALRGYIEQAGCLEPASKAIEALLGAMEKAKRPEEKKMVLGQLSSVGAGAALDTAARYLEEKGLQREAAQACHRIIATLGDAEIRARADLLKRLAASEDDELAGAAGGKVVTLESVAFALVNFQPKDGATPRGCLADTGLAFGDRGNGHSYGWDKQNGETRRRDSHEDARYNTLNHLQKGGSRRWELAAPNGNYWVRIVCGDADHSDQINHLEVEGSVQKDPDGGDNFDEYELRVKIRDGRLTIGPGPGAKNVKVCFVELRSLDAL